MGAVSKRTMSKTMPPLPKLDANGHFPAIEYTRISLARNLIRDRKAVGLSQERLAEMAGIRQETISRLESGKHTASPSTIAKIDRSGVGQAVARRSLASACLVRPASG